MTDGIDALVRALDEAISLLQSFGETHWSRWLDGDCRRIVGRDAYGLEHLLQAYGGMGSFNDLVLHRANGQDGDEEALRVANDRLWDLRDDIYAKAKRLLHERG
ncbi:hypothetical protein [Tessaracoccus sp. ZS01]|uniref:DUF6966 domain-containing protein n=1 Tax=Tessaracoccus sp. ZS01 TaxID=1906324 RepID=UPI00096EBAB7|nr:hypothetical protein [Tessaracoccus sp. ZS01]MCG6566896.1 hypothetical protein [Tessaracoccus sp. ZS01]OMG58026.1 hypothetical protein BJN44_04530 [Tessaracoccus sp. ZS01]